VKRSLAPAKPALSGPFRQRIRVHRDGDVDKSADRNNHVTLTAVEDANLLPLCRGSRADAVQEHGYCAVPAVSCEFVPNDLAVTVNSANYVSYATPSVMFQEVPPLQRQNHKWPGVNSHSEY
jgi:hypothetical protein